MYRIGLIVENAKEFKDYVSVLQLLSKQKKIKVYIISCVHVYMDDIQEKIFEKINFDYDVFFIENSLQKPFSQYSALEKIVLVMSIKRKMFLFIKDCSILLSGVQTVFERVLFCEIKKYKAKIITIVYHRHFMYVGQNGKKLTRVYRVLSFFMFFLFRLKGLSFKADSIGFADYYIVFGKENKRYLVDHGVSSNVIFPLGSIEFDNISKFVNDGVCRENSICFITGAYEWIGDIKEDQRQNKKIQEIVNFFRGKDYHLTIRVHPRERFDKYQILKQNHPWIEIQYPAHANIWLDLQQFSILIGGVSTMLFEAIVLKKRVIFYLLKNESLEFQTLLKRTGIKCMNDISDLECFLYDDTCYSVNDIVSYDPKQKAVNKIVNYISEMI